MPLPLIIGIAAGIAGAAGVGSGIRGAVKMKDAKDTMELAKSIDKNCKNKFKNNNGRTTKAMDRLGERELLIIKSFEDFSDLIEKIQNRPDFKSISENGIQLPKFDPEKLKEASIGAGVLLGGLGGAAAGTAGGFAAAGATTAAVMALGTASTGTAIASLSGAAATNAALAALGGGAIAAGGGGMALGSAVLGGATLGVGLLVGGVIFGITGSKLSDKADDAWRQAKKEEEQVEKICDYLKELRHEAEKYEDLLCQVSDKYNEHIEKMENIIVNDGKTDWNFFDDEEKRIVENTYMLAAILYKMCKVRFIIQSEDENEINEINHNDIDKASEDAETVLSKAA